MPALQEASALGVRLQGVRRRGRQGPRRKEADCHPPRPPPAQVRINSLFFFENSIINIWYEQVGPVQGQLPPSFEVTTCLTGNPGPQGACQGEGIKPTPQIYRVTH